jgi:FMN phosphatase YigB (HAD superfamily)
MEKIIIFDFNRTLYDPDAKLLVPKATFVLNALIRRGFTLFLISRGERSRKSAIDDSGIGRYFNSITISDEKNKGDFMSIIRDKKIDFENSFVVGDRLSDEIKIGNSLGFKTIRIKAGKFSDEVPQTADEIPTYSANGLEEILKMIHW